MRTVGYLEAGEIPPPSKGTWVEVGWLYYQLGFTREAMHADSKKKRAAGMSLRRIIDELRKMRAEKIQMN